MTKTDKRNIIDSFATSEGDTGSCTVQIALLTQRIKELTEHMKKNPNDNHSRRGLIRLVNQRKSLLRYMEKTDLNACRELKAKLEIR